MLAWLKQIFGKREATPAEVIGAYGDLLESNPGYVIMDITMLPKPKHEMKALIKIFYGLTSDLKMQAALANGFMFLAHFQHGVGPNPIDDGLPSYDFKMSDSPTTEELEEIMRFVSDPATSNKLERFTSWQQIAEKESIELDREWAGFLSGDPI